MLAFLGHTPSTIRYNYFTASHLSCGLVSGDNYRRGASDSIRERNLRRLPLLPVREKGAGGMREQAHWDAIPEKLYT
jgi:hypothetical protein